METTMTHAEFQALPRITADTHLEVGMCVAIPPLTASLPVMFRTITGFRPDGVVDVGGASRGWFRRETTGWRLVPAQLDNVAAAIETAKHQIVEDVASEIVPSTVQSFAELHDYIDANCYGVDCDGGLTVGSDDPARWLEAANAMQDALDAWIKTGALRAVTS
jgi:hypothetical protein